MVTNDANQRPVNQLKYVNRQLYHETAGLEITYNSVFVNHVVPNESIHHFIRFTVRCSPGKLQWLKQVVVEETATTEEKTLFSWHRNNTKSILALLKFCAENPQTTVTLQVPRFEIILSLDNPDNEHAGYNFIGQGLILSLAFRGVDLTSIAPEFGDKSSLAYDNVVQRMQRRHRRDITSLHEHTSNLKLMPRMVEWNTDEFRTSALRSWNDLARDPADLPLNALDTWVEYAHLWMSQGI